MIGIHAILSVCVRNIFQAAACDSARVDSSGNRTACMTRLHPNMQKSAKIFHNAGKRSNITAENYEVSQNMNKGGKAQEERPQEMLSFTPKLLKLVCVFF